MGQASRQANELLVTRLKRVGLWQDDLRDPTSDLNAAYEVESRLVKLGLQDRYELVLLDILERDLNSNSTLFDIVRASARQRCEAALATLNADSAVSKKYLIPILPD